MGTDVRYRVQSVERALIAARSARRGRPGGDDADRAQPRARRLEKLRLRDPARRCADAGSSPTRAAVCSVATASGSRSYASVTSSSLNTQLRDVAMPVLRLLTEETGLTSRVAILDEISAVAIGRVDARQGVVRFAANLGRREHLHNSAVGKAMLSLLPEETRARDRRRNRAARPRRPHDRRAGRAAAGSRDGAPPRLRDRRRGGQRRASSASARRSSTTRAAASARSASRGSSSTFPPGGSNGSARRCGSTPQRVSRELGRPCAALGALRVSRRALVVEQPGSSRSPSATISCPAPVRSSSAGLLRALRLGSRARPRRGRRGLRATTR